MASIGFFPSVFETSMKNYRQPKTFLYPHQPGKFLVLACYGDLTVGCCSSRAGRISLNCGRLVTRFGGVQAGKIFRSKAQGADSSDVEDDSEYEDTLQAAIEKSKKVLDRQKGLLQQIAERRKLVTSIRSSVVDPESEEVSYKGSHGSSSTLDSPSADGNVVVEDYKDGSISSSGGLFPVDDDQEVLRSVVSKDFGESSDEAEKDLALRKAFISEGSHLLGNSTAGTASDGLNESEKDLNVKIASVDTNDKKHMKQGAKKVKPNVPSSFFSSSSTVSSIKNEKDVYFEKSKFEDIKSEISVPTNEDVKPPPLAGHNVMNVILVAAECAPWSKTGLNGHWPVQFRRNFEDLQLEMVDEFFEILYYAFLHYHQEVWMTR